MSASLVMLKSWLTNALNEVLHPVTIHLFGFGNEELNGGGYHPQSWKGETVHRFQFAGETPKIYGYYLMHGDTKIYSEMFDRPWQALNAGDAVTITIHMDIKTKQKG